MNKEDIISAQSRHRFSDWLVEQQYAKKTRETYLQAIEQFQSFLRCATVNESSSPYELITAFVPRARPSSSPESSKASLRSALKLFIRFCGYDVAPQQPNTPETTLLNEYERHLRDVRGLALWTIRHHKRWGRLFLRFIDGASQHPNFDAINVNILDSFIQHYAPRFKRITTRVMVTCLRSFLRFLFFTHRVRVDFSLLVMGPRVYAQEGIPSPLADHDVETVLRCVNRGTKMGRRDYAILLLLARYGLRAGEVTRLRLDDIDWRHGHILIRQRKAGSPYRLPLLPDVARALVAYLKRGRPVVPYREIFIRADAPYRPFVDGGSLTHLCCLRIEEAGIKRSQYKGSHAFRHSLATRLLRLGQPLKAIGDVLGHRSHESTAIYAKLGVNDLRQVCLNVPRVTS